MWHLKSHNLNLNCITGVSEKKKITAVGSLFIARTDEFHDYGYDDCNAGDDDSFSCCDDLL